MNRPKTFLGLILIALGVSFFLRIDLSRIILPAFLIYLGYRALSGDSRSFRLAEQQTVEQDRINESIIFSSLNQIIKSDKFQGGQLTVVFGGGEMDISQAKAAGDIVELEVNAVFGGLKLIIPSAWQVNTDTTAVFGGISQAKPPVKAGKTVLHLKGAAVFGGIEITRPD